MVDGLRDGRPRRTDDWDACERMIYPLEVSWTPLVRTIPCRR